MRALVIVGLLAVAATAAARPAGFDHEFHDGKVTVTGAPSIPCRDCHTLDGKARVKGRPGHASCFGKCHGAAPAKPRPKAPRRKGPLAFPAAQAKVCAACHDPTTPKVGYPPYTVDPDFGLALSHASHAAVTACTTCHDRQARPAGGRSHDRCDGCHLAPAAGVPGFADCTSCHAPAWGPARGPELVPGPFAVGAGFRHAAHAKKAPGAPCTSCHAAVVAAQGADLPTPAMSDCGAGGCHDRASKAPVTEACTTCHTAAPPGSYELVRPETPYSHERHRARLPAATTCATCHALDRRGEPRTPSHRACVDSGCHAADFASTQPVTCGACHAAIEPWRPLRPDALPRPETEFGAEMPHRTHAGKSLACAGCHALADARREMRPPRGHASCQGDGCHGVQAPPAPALDACEACHRAGLVAARNDARLGAAWSVRARFAHDAHAGEPCERCHERVWEVDAMPRAPTKAVCGGCHDGQRAFKMSGHGCARCHGRAR